MTGGGGGGGGAAGIGVAPLSPPPVRGARLQEACRDGEEDVQEACRDGEGDVRGYRGDYGVPDFLAYF